MDIKVMKFLELTADKLPKTQFTKYINYYDALDRNNVGIIIEEPWIVLDIDDYEQSELMLKYCDQNNIICGVMETTRGKHFWFKNDKKLKNLIGVQNALSIKCDVRSFGNKCFVMVKRDGVFRNWIRSPSLSEISFLPKELIPLQDKLLNQKPLLSTIKKEGQGRRNALFERIIPLANNGFTKEELMVLFQKMNKLFFAQPLQNNEIVAMFSNDNIFKDKELKFSEYFSEETKLFLHYKFAYDLHEQLNGLYKSGCYYFYNNNCYTKEERYLFQKMNEIIPTLKQQQRIETLYYLKTLENVKEVKSNEWAVSLENGIYDFKEDVFKPHSSDYFITNKINCEYNPLVKTNYIVSQFLDDITCNNYKLRLVLEEILGYIFISNTMLQKAFILKGYGANGKSTFLDVIKELVGVENVAAVGLEELVERFKRSALVDKLVNISSELPETNLKNLHIFKKLVTGDIIDAEFKGKDSFTFQNTAKLIFSANELPKMNDTSEGFLRRLLIIPFKRYFNESERDALMLQKLTTPSAKSYWFNLAIQGWQRLKKNNQFTKCDLIDIELEIWSNSLNSIRRWINAADFNISKYYNKTMNTIYLDYQQYCNLYNNGKSMSLWKLKEELLIKFKNITIGEDEIIKGNNNGIFN